MKTVWEGISVKRGLGREEGHPQCTVMGRSGAGWEISVALGDAGGTSQFSEPQGNFPTSSLSMASGLMRGQEFPDNLLYLPRIMKRTEQMSPDRRPGSQVFPSHSFHPASHRIRSSSIKNIFFKKEVPHDSALPLLSI